MGETDEKVEFEGEVTEALRGRLFRVLLDNDDDVLGDRMRIELSTYDLTPGRIVYRLG